MIAPWNDPVILAAVDVARREGVRSVVAQVLVFALLLGALCALTVLLWGVMPTPTPN